VAYSWIVNGGGGRSPTIAVPTGLMMVYDDKALWGVQKKYLLVEKENRPFSDDEESLPDFRKIPRDQVNRSRWTAKLPLRPRAMLKSGDNLVIGGMPTGRQIADPYAAYEGRSKGIILVASAKDGSPFAQYEIASAPVWDGMSAAGGKLFLSTCDGSLRCFAPAK